MHSQYQGQESYTLTFFYILNNKYLGIKISRSELFFIFCICLQEGNLFGESVFNETVNIIELEEGLDGETFFLYVFLCALVVLLLVVGQQFLVSVGKKRVGKKPVIETGTTNPNDVDYEWLPKEMLSTLSKYYFFFSHKFDFILSYKFQKFYYRFCCLFFNLSFKYYNFLWSLNPNIRLITWFAVKLFGIGSPGLIHCFTLWLLRNEVLNQSFIHNYNSIIINKYIL